MTVYQILWSFECQPEPGFHGYLETELDILYVHGLAFRESMPLPLASRMPPPPPP